LLAASSAPEAVPKKSRDVKRNTAKIIRECI
jgi:hypothetical protein